MSTYQRFMLPIAIISCMVLFLGCSAESDGTVSASKLVSDYFEDELKASDSYGDKFLTITGTVLKFDHPDGKFVILNGPGGNRGNVWCHSSTLREAANISRLGQHDLVELQGQAVGFEDAQKERLRVENCTVRKIVPATATPQVSE